MKINCKASVAAADEASQTTTILSHSDVTKRSVVVQPNTIEAIEYNEQEIQKIKSALSHISSDKRETWIKVGMALKSRLGDDGLDVWDEWSEESESYDPRNIMDTWNSFVFDGEITIGTLFYLAKENGWNGNGTSSTIKKINHQNEKESSEYTRDDERENIQAECREVSKAIWDKAKPAPEDHPYLIKKKVKPHNLRVHKESLVVPVMDFNSTIHGLHFIAPEKNDEGRDKFFKKGTVKTGHCHLIGGKPEAVLYLAEGFATAATIHEATNEPVIVCFDAGNLMPVAEMLRDKLPDLKIVICADNDQKTKGNPGLTKGRKAALAIGGLLASPVFPDGETGSDFNDLAAVVGTDEVKRQIEAAEVPVEDQPISKKLTVMDSKSFLKHLFPPRETMLAPWLTTQSLSMVYAPRGVGKTHFSLGVAYAVASGGSFLKWTANKPLGVLLIDGEMPGPVLQERISAIAVSKQAEPPELLKIITPDLQLERMLNLSDVDDQNLLIPHLDGIDLIIVDNLSTLCRSGKENEGESWLPVQQWALEQRSAGRSVLFVHHAGKNGGQRGTSRREDVLDTVISLRRPGDYTPDKGACFEIHFEKARGLFGDDTKPFEVMLTTGQDGTQTWTMKGLEQSTAEKVANLIKDGVRQKDIAELLGITEGAVSKAKNRAQMMA